MRRHPKKRQKLLVLLLLKFILSINYSYAKTGRWKPGNEYNRKFPINRTLQVDEKNPIDRTLQNERRIPIDRTLQVDKKKSIDGTLQNDRRIPIDRTLQVDKTNLIDKTLQNDRRIPIDRTLQVHKTNPIDRTLQNDRRIPTYKTNEPDGIMQKHKRMKINQILEQDRRSHDELKMKIDRLLQDENIQVNKRVRGGGRMLNNRRMQNDGKIQNNLKVQNTRLSLDKYNKRMMAANFHPILRNDTSGDKNSIPDPKTSTSIQSPVNQTTYLTNRQRLLREDVATTNVTQEPEEVTLSPEEIKSMMEDVANKMSQVLSNIEGYQPYEHRDLKIRACYCIATTYISARQDFKRYYERRNTYANSVEFEVGYLVGEIVSKYQRMLELYNMAVDYYFSAPITRHMSSTYMLYMYTNVLEMGTVIAHLCNMLTEIENKYMHMQNTWSGFSDYHHILKEKSKDDPEAKEAREADKYEKMMKKLAKKGKITKRKPRRKKEYKLGHLMTTPARKPQHTSWRDFTYGWSIEYWW